LELLFGYLKDLCARRQRANVQIGADGTPRYEANVDFQFEIVPADGTRLPMGGAETSVRRRF
jgi:hypothetical protein